MPRQVVARRQQEITFRTRVLVAIEASPCWLTSRQIAEATGLSYKQTIFALNALNNAAKIARAGRKFTARWGRLALSSDSTLSDSFALLQSCFNGFFRGPNNSK